MTAPRSSALLCGVWMLLAVCGLACVRGTPAAVNAPTPLRKVTQATGTWAVSVCTAPCGSSQSSENHVFARGKIVVLAQEDAALGESLRQYYPYCNTCDDSTFAHVRLCFQFARVSAVGDSRLGPYPRGFGDIDVFRSDSIAFALGQTDDAGYGATVAIRGDSMVGLAQGWGGSQVLFHMIVKNGQKIWEPATAEERARTAPPTDYLVGTRAGPPDERVCRGGR